MQADPNPPLSAWTGKWKYGENNIAIQPAKQPDKLELSGDAVWHGSGDVVHTGDFQGEAAPAGNKLHFADRNADSCAIDFRLLGTYMVADDNEKCGGINVRFSGLWRKEK